MLQLLRALCVKVCLSWEGASQHQILLLQELAGLALGWRIIGTPGTQSQKPSKPSWEDRTVGAGSNHKTLTRSEPLFTRRMSAHTQPSLLRGC